MTLDNYHFTGSPQPRLPIVCITRGVWGVRFSRATGFLLGVAALTLGTLPAAAVADDGIIGPQLGLQNSGRELHPAGRMVDLGNFPTGGAITPDGRFYWTVSTGRGRNDIRIVDVRNARVIQTLPIPGASGGIAMDPVHPLVYVSGIADSDPGHADQQRPGLPGRQGDVVHVFRYGSTGRATFRRLISVPPPVGTQPPQNFPPTTTTAVAWPDRLAISRDGATLLVPLNLADQAAIVRVRTGAVTYVSTGSYPYGAAITPNGQTGLVSNEATGTVSFINLASGTKLGDVDLGHLTHPEAIAIDRFGRRAYVAVANDDRVAVLDIASRSMVQSLSTARAPGDGTSPIALALTPDNERLIVAESGADDLSIFRTYDGSLAGRVPTASYPADVQVTRDGRNLLWLSAKGLGSGPNPNGPNPFETTDANTNSFEYLPIITFGKAGILRFPADGEFTAEAEAQIYPTNSQDPPAGTPLAPGGPIQHVFYLVKENRSYDQVLGDDERGDGDPSLTLFGDSATPNTHALARRFPLLDHLYANSEASIDGHFWTSAAKVSDYVHKNWHQNYGGRGRPYDFGVYAVTFPQNKFLFDQAQTDGISYYNYGEAIAGVVGVFPDKDRTPDVALDQERKLAFSDLGQNGCYANDSSVGKDSVTGQPVFDSSLPAGAPNGSSSRFDCFNQRFQTQLATGTVPSFSYLVLTNNHTRGLEVGARTPQAMIADNDLALGEIIETISHSSVWPSSAIFVIEDDSQDGADHVDAHRTIGAVISPYARRGAVVSNRYDQLSMIRSMELILGMQPLGLHDALATPMYDAFSSTPGNAEPYDALPENVDLLDTNANTATNQALSAGLDMNHGVDRVPQRKLDAVLWKAVHGASSTPPPPGPNAVGEGEEEDED
jgi:DNA-binding beta-propeller fold protein YncE